MESMRNYKEKGSLVLIWCYMFINELYNSVFHFAKKEDRCEHLRFHYLSGIYLGLDFTYFVE